MDMKKFFAIAIAFYYILPLTFSAGIGMGPAEIKINNAMRGYEYPNMIFIQNTFENEINISLSAEGECKDWISIYYYDNQKNPIKEVKVGPISSINLLSKTKIPLDVEPGEYKCTLYAQQVATPKEGEQILVLRIGILFKINVIGEELPKGEVRGASLNNPKVGEPLIFEIIFENTGNTPATPIINSSIIRNGVKIKDILYNNTTIAPKEVKTIVLKISTEGMIPGYYNMPTKVFLANLVYEREDLGFRLLGEEEKNEIDILKIDYDENINLGSHSNISLLIRNNQDKNITAKIISEVYSDEKVTEKLESEEFILRSNKENKIIYQFVPKKDGNYYINIFISYDNTTIPAGNIKINVQKNDNENIKDNLGVTGMLVSYPIVSIGIILLIIIIAILLYSKMRSEPEWKKLKRKLKK